MLHAIAYLIPLLAGVLASMVAAYLRIGLRTYCQLSQPRRVSSTTLARSASSRPAKQA